MLPGSLEPQWRSRTYTAAMPEGIQEGAPLISFVDSLNPFDMGTRYSPPPLPPRFAAAQTHSVPGSSFPSSRFRGTRRSNARLSPGRALGACSTSARTFGPDARSGSNGHAGLCLYHRSNVRHPPIGLQPFLMLIGIGHNNHLVGTGLNYQFLQGRLHG